MKIRLFFSGGHADVDPKSRVIAASCGPVVWESPARLSIGGYCDVGTAYVPSGLRDRRELPPRITLDRLTGVMQIQEDAS